VKRTRSFSTGCCKGDFGIIDVEISIFQECSNNSSQAHPDPGGGKGGNDDSVCFDMGDFILDFSNQH